MLTRRENLQAQRSTGRRLFYSAAFYSIAFLFLTACTPSRKEALTLLFTGDVLLDRGVRPIIETHGVEYLFEGVTDEFARADAVIINLECPLADTLSAIGKQYSFRADTHSGIGLRSAGITHACLANNHTNDQSRRGLHSTARTLRNDGITPIGYGATAAERLRPVLIKKGGITAALFNSVTFPLENWIPADSLPDVCQLKAEALAAVIHDYKAAHPDHYTIAILHWGTEFQTTPSMHQRLGAAALAAVGCDAIIGHHPHVIQAASLTGQQVPVFYSLGNFVFDQSAPTTRHAVMAELVLTPDTLIARAMPVTLRRCRPFVR